MPDQASGPRADPEPTTWAATHAGQVEADPDPDPADDPDAADPAAEPAEAEGEGGDWIEQVVGIMLARIEEERNHHEEWVAERVVDCKAIEVCADGISRLVTPDPAAVMNGSLESYRTIPTPPGTQRKVARFIAAMAEAGAAAAKREAAR